MPKSELESIKENIGDLINKIDKPIKETPLVNAPQPGYINFVNKWYTKLFYKLFILFGLPFIIWGLSRTFFSDVVDFSYLQILILSFIVRMLKIPFIKIK